MKVVGAVTIGKLIEAHYEKDEHKFKSYAEFIADAYKERGEKRAEKRAERIIRSRIDGSYKDKPVVGFDEVMELGRMTIEEIKQKTSLCFLLNPNIPEEEKICVIEKVMATKATIVPKAALCNIITYILKQNAELKEKVSYLEDNLRVARKDRKNLQLEVGKGLKEFIKDCPYSALKFYVNEYYAEQLTKAKEIIKDYMTIAKGSHTTVCGVPEENRTIYVLKLNEKAEQLIREVQ